MDREREQSDRKPYVAPELTVHGDLRELTRTKGGTTNDGGGAKPLTRITGKPL